MARSCARERSREARGKGGQMGGGCGGGRDCRICALPLPPMGHWESTGPFAHLACLRPPAKARAFRFADLEELKPSPRHLPGAQQDEIPHTSEGRVHRVLASSALELRAVIQSCSAAEPAVGDADDEAARVIMPDAAEGVVHVVTRRRSPRLERGARGRRDAESDQGEEHPTDGKRAENPYLSLEGEGHGAAVVRSVAEDEERVG